MWHWRLSLGNLGITWQCLNGGPSDRASVQLSHGKYTINGGSWVELGSEGTVRRSAFLISMLIFFPIRLIFHQSRLIFGLSGWLELIIAVQYLALSHSPIQIEQLQRSLRVGRDL